MIWPVLAAIGGTVLGYTWVAYPAGMALRARWRGKDVAAGPWKGRAVALMSARGEGARVAAKVRELAESARTEGLSGVRVGLDGGTEEEARALRAELEGVAEASGCAVEVRAVPGGGGKSAVLAELMREGGAEAWVMVDVRQRVEPGAVRALLECLADATVGAASGEMRFGEAGNAQAKGADSYWSYEKRLREAESRVWAVPGATGALYAVRAADTEPPPPGVVLDDVWIPMRAVLRGKRCLFVRGAVAWDVPETDSARERARKRRTNAGNWQMIGLEPALLAPWRNPAWGVYWSHKVLRLLTPFAAALLYAGLAGAAWSAGWRGPWTWIWAAATAGAAASAVAYGVAGRVKSRWTGLLGAAWGMTWCLLGAAWDACRGKYRGAWKSKG